MRAMVLDGVARFAHATTCTIYPRVVRCVLMSARAVRLDLVDGSDAVAVLGPVDLRCDDAKMLHVAARPHATLVVNLHAFGDRTNVALPHISVNEYRPPLVNCVAIPAPNLCAVPHMARAFKRCDRARLRTISNDGVGASCTTTPHFAPPFPGFRRSMSTASAYRAFDSSSIRSHRAH